MNNDAKIIIWDLETTSLKADFGYLLCAGYKWYGAKQTYVPKIDRKTDPLKFRKAEKALVKEFYDSYCSADLSVTYYGTGFDIPYFQAKCLEHGIGMLPNIPQVDLYYTVKHKLGISRKSLQNAAYYLDLSNEKTPVEGRIWVDAMMGSPSALKYIVDHCRADVLVLEELYTKLRGLVRMHPRVGGYGPCRACGSTKLQSRGPALTKNKNQQRRVHCQNCGSWDLRAY